MYVHNERKEKTKLHLTESLQREIQSYTTYCDFFNHNASKSKTQNPKLKIQNSKSKNSKTQNPKTKTSKTKRQKLKIQKTRVFYVISLLLIC